MIDGPFDNGSHVEDANAAGTCVSAPGNQGWADGPCANWELYDDPRALAASAIYIASSRAVNSRGNRHWWYMSTLQDEQGDPIGNDPAGPDWKPYFFGTSDPVASSSAKYVICDNGANSCGDHGHSVDQRDHARQFVCLAGCHFDQMSRPNGAKIYLSDVDGVGGKHLIADGFQWESREVDGEGCFHETNEPRLEKARLDAQEAARDPSAPHLLIDGLGAGGALKALRDARLRFGAPAVPQLPREVEAHRIVAMRNLITKEVDININVQTVGPQPSNAKIFVSNLDALQKGRQNNRGWQQRSIQGVTWQAMTWDFAGSGKVAPVKILRAWHGDTYIELASELSFPADLERELASILADASL